MARSATSQPEDSSDCRSPHSAPAIIGDRSSPGSICNCIRFSNQAIEIQDKPLGAIMTLPDPQDKIGDRAVAWRLWSQSQIEWVGHRGVANVDTPHAPQSPDRCLVASTTMTRSVTLQPANPRPNRKSKCITGTICDRQLKMPIISAGVVANEYNSGNGADFA